MISPSSLVGAQGAETPGDPRGGLFKGSAGGSRKDTKDIAKGALINFFGALLQGMNLIFYFFLGRIYGPAETGLFLLSRASLDILSKMGILGLDRAMLSLGARKTAEQDEEGFYRILGQAFFLGLMSCTVLTVCLRGAFALGISLKPETVKPIGIMAWGIFFWLLSSLFLFATRTLRVMHYEVICKSIVEPSVLLVSSLLFYRFFPGIEGLAYAFLFSTAAGAGVALYLFSRVLSLRKLFHGAFQRSGRGRLFRFAFPIGLYDMLNMLLQRIDMMMVGRFLSASAVGIYGLAEEASFVLKKVRQSFDPIFIPVISVAQQTGDRRSLSTQYRNVTRWILLLDLGLLGIFILNSRTIMGLFGPLFVPGAAVLGWISLSVVINTTLGVSELFILIERPTINLMNTVGTIVLNVLLNLWLIPRYGLVGAALSIVLSYGVMNTVRVVQVGAIFRLVPFTLYHLKIFLSFLVALAAGALFRSFAVSLLPTVLREISAAALFLFLYNLFMGVAGLAPEEKALVRKIFPIFFNSPREE